MKTPFPLCFPSQVRRVEQRLQRLRLVASWRKWLAVADEEQQQAAYREQQLRRAVLSMLMMNLIAAWRSWQDLVSRRRRGCLVVQRLQQWRLAAVLVEWRAAAAATHRFAARAQKRLQHTLRRRSRRLLRLTLWAAHSYARMRILRRARVNRGQQRTGVRKQRQLFAAWLERTGVARRVNDAAFTLLEDALRRWRLAVELRRHRIAHLEGVARALCAAHARRGMTRLFGVWVAHRRARTERVWLLQQLARRRKSLGLFKKKTQGGRSCILCFFKYKQCPCIVQFHIKRRTRSSYSMEHDMRSLFFQSSSRAC